MLRQRHPYCRPPGWRALHSAPPGQPQQKQQPAAAENDGGSEAAAGAAAERARASAGGATEQGEGGRRAASGSSLASLPNLLSLSRVAAAPVVSWLMLTDQWGPAVALLAAAAATDWADGAVARRLGHTSKLGSYLDPLADKVLVCSAVATLGWLQLLPAWLAALVVARDAGQIGVTLAYRLAMFGGRWPSLAAFADVDGQPRHAGQEEGAEGARAADAASAEEGAAPGCEQRQEQQAQQAPPGRQPPAEMPRIRPLLVSKLNTALAFLLAGGAVAHQWQGLPPAEALAALEAAVGATTAASGLAYIWLWRSGKLLQR